MSSKPSMVGKKVVQIAQKARGRTPFKYELEVIPFFAGKSGNGESRYPWGIPDRQNTLGQLNTS